MHWPDQVRAALAATAVREPSSESALACAAWCRLEAGEAVDWDALDIERAALVHLLDALRHEDLATLESVARELVPADGLYDVFAHPWPRQRPLAGLVPTFDLAASPMRPVLALRRVLLLMTESARDLFNEVEGPDDALDALLDDVDEAPALLFGAPERVLGKAPLLERIEAALLPVDHEIAGRFSRARALLTVVLTATPSLAADDPQALASALALAHAAAHDFTTAVCLSLGELDEDQIDDLSDMADDIAEVTALEHGCPAEELAPLQRRIRELTPAMDAALRGGDRAAIVGALEGLFDVLLALPDGPEWGHVVRPFLDTLHAAIDETAEVLRLDPFDLRARGLDRTLRQLAPA